MMAAPFLAFLISLLLARWGTSCAAVGMFFVALVLSAAVFVYHIDQSLSVQL